MGVIYVNGGYKKAKQPVSFNQLSINIDCSGQNSDISVEEDVMIISSESTQSDKVVENEILNID